MQVQRGDAAWRGRGAWGIHLVYGRSLTHRRQGANMHAGDAGCPESVECLLGLERCVGKAGPQSPKVRVGRPEAPRYCSGIAPVLRRRCERIVPLYNPCTSLIYPLYIPWLWGGSGFEVVECWADEAAEGTPRRKHNSAKADHREQEDNESPEMAGFQAL